MTNGEYQPGGPLDATQPGAATSWSTQPKETALAGLLAVVLVVVGPTVDPVGRVMVWGAALMLLAVVTADLLVRPRLRAGPGGLAVRTLTARHRAEWSQVHARVRETRRLGRSVPTLEIDLRTEPAMSDGYEEPDEVYDVFIVLGRRELGADPALVHRSLLALRS